MSLPSHSFFIFFVKRYTSPRIRNVLFLFISSNAHALPHRNRPRARCRRVASCCAILSHRGDLSPSRSFSMIRFRRLFGASPFTSGFQDGIHLNGSFPRRFESHLHKAPRSCSEPLRRGPSPLVAVSRRKRDSAYVSTQAWPNRSSMCRNKSPAAPPRPSGASPSEDPGSCPGPPGRRFVMPVDTFTPPRGQRFCHERAPSGRSQRVSAPSEKHFF